MPYTDPTTQPVNHIVLSSEWNRDLVDNFKAIATAAGLLLHEAGGIEADISAIAAGGLLRGSGAGAMNILANFLTGDLVRHEHGGIETDISAIADGGILRGTGAGAMGILASFLTAGGLVRHEQGGIEANIAAIASGGILRGTGAGAMGILASFLTAGGLVRHEQGGIEANISAITTGGLLKGSAAGAMGILARGAALEGLRVNAAGTDLEYATPLTPTSVFQTTNQTITTTTLTNSNDLTVALLANTDYVFILGIGLDVVAASDLKFNMSAPTGASGRYLYLIQDTTSLASGYVFATIGTQNVEFIATGIEPLIIIGSVQVGGTAGNLVFQWANNSGANNNTLRQNSMMLVAQV